MGDHNEYYRGYEWKVDGDSNHQAEGFGVWCWGFGDLHMPVLICTLILYSYSCLHRLFSMNLHSLSLDCSFVKNHTSLTMVGVEYKNEPKKRQDSYSQHHNATVPTLSKDPTS
jgi:hypothetical protein